MFFVFVFGIFLVGVVVLRVCLVIIGVLFSCWVCLVCDSFLFRLVCVLGFCFGWLRG